VLIGFIAHAVLLTLLVFVYVPPLQAPQVFPVLYATVNCFSAVLC
jgi:hypothetical protein